MRLFLVLISVLCGLLAPLAAAAQQGTPDTRPGIAVLPFTYGGSFGSRREDLAPLQVGVQQMLIRSGIETKGANAVILGRSNIVGRPMMNLLIQDAPGGNATVTVCHSRSRDLPSITRGADILVAAIGKPRFITADMVKPGAVVIDVGINRVEDASAPKGYKIVGDVDYGPVSEVASAITPVPGGVGKMTIAMLLMNTLQAARQARPD